MLTSIMSILKSVDHIDYKHPHCRMYVNHNKYKMNMNIFLQRSGVYQAKYFNVLSKVHYKAINLTNLEYVSFRSVVVIVQLSTNMRFFVFNIRWANVKVSHTKFEGFPLLPAIKAVGCSTGNGALQVG